MEILLILSIVCLLASFWPRKIVEPSPVCEKGELKTIKKSLNRVEHFLLENYEVYVEYGPDLSDQFLDDANLVEINDKQDYRSRLCILLHEAGHVVLRRRLTEKQFRKSFPAMKKAFRDLRRNTAHRIDVLREEVLAWEEALQIAKSLKIKLNSEHFNKQRERALLSYAQWVK